MAQIFPSAGQSADDGVTYPDLYGVYVPSIDNAQGLDGLGITSPWSAGPTAIKTGEAGSYTAVGGAVSSGALSISGGTAVTYNIEGLVGPQGIQGVPGDPGLISTIKQQVFVPYGTEDIDTVLKQIRDEWTEENTILYSSESTIFWDRPWVLLPVKAGVLSWNDASVGTDGEYIGIVSDEGIYVSTDGGDNWTETDPGTETYSSVRVAGTSGDGVAVGDTTKASGKVWTTANSGANWSESTAITGVDLELASSYLLGEDGSRNISDYFSMLDPYGSRYGQNWLVGVGGYSVSRVRVKVARVGSPGTINCRIYALTVNSNSGVPTGEALGTASLDADTFGASPSHDWTNFDFSSSVALSSSTWYAFTFDVPAGDDNNYVEIRSDDSTPVASGSAVYTIDNGTTWYTLPSSDLQYYVYKDPITAVTSVDLDADGNNLLACSADGVWLSDDLGVSWTQHKPDSQDSTVWDAGIIGGGGTYVIVLDEDGNIYRTANGGTGWAAITPAGGDTFVPIAIDASDDGAYVLIVGTNATDSEETLWRSKDYGSSWTAITNPTIQGDDYDWTGCQISNNGKLLMVSRENAFYLSFDAGVKWEEASVPAAGSDWACTGISGDGKVGLICDVTVANQFYTNSGWYKKPTISEATITDTALSILDDDSVADAASTLGLGTGDSPVWTGATFSGLTASRIVATNGSKALVSLASPLIVGEGGTGTATLTNHSLLLGSGTDAITLLGAATDGQIPIGSTGIDPVLATITGTANQIAIANAAGSITLSLTGQMDNIAALTPTNGNFIVGDGANWVTESGGTVQSSLGLAIGTNVQAWDGDLDDIAALTPTDGNFIVGDGSNWVAESGNTARTSLGLGTTDSPTFTGLSLTDTQSIQISSSSNAKNCFDLDLNTTQATDIVSSQCAYFTATNLGAGGITGSLRGVQAVCVQNGDGTVADMYPVLTQIRQYKNGSVVTKASGLYIASPSIPGTGTIGTLHGLYIDAQNHANVTTAYGVYQAGASDYNYFNGDTGIGIDVPLAKLDVVGTSRFGDSATNYAGIAANGHLVLNGTARVWKDENAKALVLTGPAATRPGTVVHLDSAGNSTLVACLGFAVNDSASGVIEIPHDYAEGTDITPHIHWQGIADPGGTKYVKWQLTYTRTRDDVVTPVATAIVVETAIATQYMNKLSSFPAITGTDYKIGDQFGFQLKRIASVGAAYAGEALIDTLGIHYQANTIGSSAMLTK